MKRHLIWIIAGCATLTLAVPALAASRDAGTPDDNGVPGEVRGNCDELEHAGDPACISVVTPSPTPTVTTPTSTTPTSIPSSSVPSSTIPSSTAPSSSSPSTGDPSSSTPSVSAPSVSVPSSSTPSTSVPGDISGPCDEAEHAADPRCSGATDTSDDGDHDDRSGRSSDDDHSDDDHDDDDRRR